ncbi:acyl-CoA dehydrogenase family protein, partial [Acinetobacter baumannii]
MTEEQEAVRKMVRSFVDKEILPYIQEWDEKGHFERSIMTRLA